MQYMNVWWEWNSKDAGVIVNANPQTSKVDFILTETGQGK
jgi:hypothetical protein